jgi:hypothetical protein
MHDKAHKRSGPLDQSCGQWNGKGAGGGAVQDYRKAKQSKAKQSRESMAAWDVINSRN